jgi:hypothetical protein
MPGGSFAATLGKELAAEGFVIAARGGLQVESVGLHRSYGQIVDVQTDAIARRAKG